jgi:hypothetical protein
MHSLRFTEKGTPGAILGRKAKAFREGKRQSAKGKN